MLLSIIGLLLTIYIMYALAIFVVDFNHIFNFFKYEAPAEIAVFKKEFNIKNKIFDYIAMVLFLVVLPFTYNSIRGEC